jgi:hypothetical protein
MNNTQFVLILLILAIIYSLKDYITDKINQYIFPNTKKIHFKSIYLSYILFFILLISLVLGMQNSQQTVKKYSNVSDGFKKIRSKDKDRPNPLFDIDTYW